ncbi:MAG: hypothetical protein ACXABF_11360 [Candidatus Thorarchaeota archaeon]|jgi:hypothetical protein
MIRGLKKAGWAQGIYEISAEKKERIGTLRILQDGRKFRYARAGATPLAVGKLTSAAGEAVANLLDENVASGQGAAIGDDVIDFTSAGAVTYAANYFEGGFYNVNDGTGEGQLRGIESSSAVTAGTAIKIVLDSPLKVATVATTTQHTIIASPWMATIIHATVDFHCAGVPVLAATANYYYWSQTSGFASVWNSGTTAAGSRLMPHTTDGQVILDDAFTEMEVGYMGPQVGVDTEYMIVFLTLE